MIVSGFENVSKTFEELLQSGSLKHSQLVVYHHGRKVVVWQAAHPAATPLLMEEPFLTLLRLQSLHRRSHLEVTGRRQN